MQFLDEFKKGLMWGMLTSVDLFECNPKKIRSKQDIKEYVKQLCKKIDMKTFGETIVVRFGKDKRVQGYSMTQLIETSLISGHFAENTNSAYLDIFSCKYYNAEEVEDFSKKFFEAKKSESNITFRKMPEAAKNKLLDIPNSKNWFFESIEFNQGRALALKAKQLYSTQSSFQKIEVYNTNSFGKMLVLDGAIQLTQADEFAYHEMIVHPALNTHPKTEKVLIIGGADGGTARETAKHKTIKEIHLCDLDKKVVLTSKKFLPFTAAGLKDKRLSVFHKDGFKFLKEKENYYDVIIIDSTDPIGVGKILFSSKFFKLVFNSLKKDGIMVNQFQSMFYEKKLIKEITKTIKKIFPKFWYYYTLVPSYPSGTIGFGFASKKHSPLNPKNKNIKDLKYYNLEIHKASFVLPKFMEKIV